ncbi:MAG: cbb3-type cytochrome c oxidase subunit 3 [Bdellovibrionaceae bacterium]|nr:cbb3-type cytochrome c oxidase subunit 3 [Pseudobdellovibrionaceae bacterium]
MTKQWLAHFNDTQLALFGFLLFFAVFMAVLGWTFRMGAQRQYKKISELPLSDEKNYGENL